MKSPQEKVKGRRRRRSPQECRHVVCEYLSSGESLWRFAQRTEISYGSLRSWVKRYGPADRKEDAQAQSFVELPASSIASAQIVASVRFASGTEITVHAGCDSALAQTLIKSLR